jgi:hypothetical protein
MIAEDPAQLATLTIELDDAILVSKRSQDGVTH